ncbi:MAG: hypothetical protein ACRD4O_04880 [Bryobacteraceae bacterium]
MRVLFDHNVPKKLRRSLAAHEVRTAQEMCWQQLENGDLLTAAERAGFEVMVTGDKNLSYQQNLTDRKLALVVLGTNDWNVLKLWPELVAAAVDRARPGSFERVEAA